MPLDGGVWRNGRVHRVLCDACGDIIREHHPPAVQRWPGGRGKAVFDNGGYAPVYEERAGKNEEEEEDG